MPTARRWLRQIAAEKLQRNPRFGIKSPKRIQDFEIPGVSKIQQMEEQMAHMQMENKNMSDRMANLEMGMQELIQHLRGMSVKTEA